MFSKRTTWDLLPSPLAEAWADRQRRDRIALDLTVSNPTTAGFSLEMTQSVNALADGASAPYDPMPFGLPQARAAVCDYYRRSHSCELEPGRIVLTVSTSEAYSFLFRLLCDPGDEVLYLRPSYPLFDFLAGLDDVVLRPAALFYDHGWHVDRTAIQAAVTPRTCAVLLVHPNNPTGHFTTLADRTWLDDFCAAQNLAVIVDEVFLDYSLGQPATSFLAGEPKALTFVLSGLSKVSALPQMKLAWIATAGPRQVVEAATQRLEVIADTFLSVNTPMQMALFAMLDVRVQIQPQIHARLRSNLTALDELLAAQRLVARLEVEGGWYAVLRIPALEDSEAAAIRLVREAGVYVHPGSFFGFASEGIFVVSLLTPEDDFRQAILLLLSHIQNFE